MKTILTTILLFNFLCAIAYSQNSIALKPNFGLYAYNSENSLEIMGENNLIINYGFGLNYERENFLGYDVRVEYSLFYSIRETLEFFLVSEFDPTPIGVSYLDVSLYGHSFDFSIKDSLLEWLYFGVGPSVSIVNRSVQYESADFEDCLASLCLGLNGYLEIRQPLSDDPQHFFFTAGLTLRYLHSFWFDEKGRNLNDYSQNYITSIFSAGFGYNF